MTKNVLIFGGSKGLGFEILKDLIKSDFKITVISRKKDKIKNLKDIDKLTFIKCNILNDKSLNQLLKKFKKNKYKADIIIHSIGGNIKKKQNENFNENFYNNWKFNFGYSININDFFLNTMLKNKWGRILHISTAGIKSYETSIAYTSAKVALNNYVNSYGKELSSKNIVLSSISPGPIELNGRYLYEQMLKNSKYWKNFQKKHLPTGKLVKPSEILPLVRLLISDNATAYSSVNWDVDGGYF